MASRKNVDPKNVRNLLFYACFVLVVAFVAFQTGRSYGTFQASVDYAKKLSIECYAQLAK